MELTVLIPAKNEEENILPTVKNIFRALQDAGIDHTILVINDHSEDKTEGILRNAAHEIPTLVIKNNPYPSGFGNAIQYSLSQFETDAVAIAMADAAENPQDIVRCFQILESDQVDCVFGSRFIKGGKVYNYPFFSLILNRIFNQFIRLLFYWPYNDFTNSFKIYKKAVIHHVQPLESGGFSITIELSLKALQYTRNIKILPIRWYNRQKGRSKFNLLKNLPHYLKVLIKVKTGYSFHS